MWCSVVQGEWADSEGVAPPLGSNVQNGGVGGRVLGGGDEVMVRHVWEYPPAPSGPNPGSERDGRVARAAGTAVVRSEGSPPPSRVHAPAIPLAIISTIS